LIKSFGFQSIYGYIRSHNPLPKLMETVPVSFNEGIKKILLRDYAGAISDFTRSIEEEPNNIAAYNNRGYAKSKLKDTTGEIEDYTKAIEIDPEDETALFNRGISKVRLRDYQGAITDMNKVIEMSPQNSKAYYYRAISRDNTKIDTHDQQALAVADILKALEINPDLQIPFINNDPERVWIHDCVEKIRNYSFAIKYNACDTNAYYERARLKEKAHDIKGALEDFAKITEIDHFDAHAHECMATIKLRYLDDYDGALSEYAAAIKINPYDSDIYIERAEIKEIYEDYTGAVQDYTEIIDLCNKEDFNFEEDNKSVQNEAYNLRARVKEKQNDYIGAISDFSNAIELDPLNYHAFCDRGSVKTIIKDYTGVINDINEALKIDKTYYQAYFYRGKLKLELQDYSGAIVDFNRTIKLYPKWDRPCEVYHFRGIAKIALGRKRSGSEDIKIANSMGY